jgi:hypothetical protein
MTKKPKPRLSLPKAPPVPRVGATKAARVVGKDDSPTSKRSKAQKAPRLSASGKRLGRPPKAGGAKHATWERLQCFIPPELATRLRVLAANRRADLSDLVAEALEAYLPTR